MPKPQICHETKPALLDALESCLSSGLEVLIDGVPQTRESLEEGFTLRDAENWTGTLMLGEKGDLEGLSFSTSSES